MASWYFDSSERSYVSNETITPKNSLLGWDMKAPYISSESSNITVANNTPDYPTDVGIAVILAKQYDRKNVPLHQQHNVVYKDDESAFLKCTATSSVVDSNSRESLTIDPKMSTSAETSISTKRARGVSSLSSHRVSYCQVFGCNKDLSSAKDYHKRHKVCDFHSKSASVIVNGIEQRFCHQCSRFHLLAEFDDGKRSCRKRLAGHNERRRKPEVGFGSNRSGRLLHSYTGSISSKFQRTTLATSFICQDILGPTHSEKYPTHSSNKDIKIEDGASAYGQLDQKTILPPYLFGKQYTSVLDNGVYTENSNQYPHETVSHSLFQPLYNTESVVQGIPGMSESGCALSLLSSQSHSSHSSNASVIQSSCPHFGMIQVYDSQGLTTKNYSNTLPMLDDVDVDFANGSMLDLLQLSSQIQRVENQRQTETVKQDNERFLLS